MIGPVALFPIPERMPDIIEGEMGYRWAGLGAVSDTFDLAQGWEQPARHSRIVLNDAEPSGPHIALKKGAANDKSKRHIRLHRAKPFDPALPKAGIAGLWNSRVLEGLLFSFRVISRVHFDHPVRFLFVEENSVAVRCSKRPTLIVPPGIYCVLADALRVPERDDLERWGKARRDYFPDNLFRVALEIN